MRNTRKLVGVVVAFAVVVVGTAGSEAGVRRSTSAPMLSGQPTIAGTLQQSEVLTASRPAATGTSPIAFTYQWLRCDSASTTVCDEIRGGTEHVYTLAAADVGRRIRVRVTARNADGADFRTSDPSAIVAPADAPRNSSLPLISGTMRVRQTLTASTGAWTGTKPISYAFDWLRCNAVGSRCATVPGANRQSYALTDADRGRTMRVLVTAANVGGKSTALSQQTAIVAERGTAPASTRAPVISGTAAPGGTLVVSDGSWQGTTPISFGYRWTRCDTRGNDCRSIAGATGRSYVVTAEDVGHTLRCAVTATNHSGSSTRFSKQTAVVQAVPQPQPTGAVAVASVSLPDRLVIDKVSFSPSPIRSHASPLTARFHVSTTGGRPVSGALVYAVGVPYDRISAGREVATDGDGWATIVFDVTPRLQIRRGNRLVVFVRTRKPGDNLLAGISSRRLVSVRTG